MAAEPRYIPLGGAVVEVSNRTTQGRFLLRPSPNLNEIIIGVMGRAQRLFDISIYAFQFLSDHFHLLLGPVDAHQLAGFMGYFDGNLAREAGRFSRWSGRVWHRRYHSAIVNADEKSHLERLRYIMSNGCKEGLVSSPREWPGVSSTSALLDGSMSLQGTWFDRTQEYRARETKHPQVFASREWVHLSPLPSLADVGQPQFRALIETIVEQIEAETALMHSLQGTQPVGPKWVLRQNPHRVPKKMKKSPAKRFLAAFKQSVIELRAAYMTFIQRYREASARLRAGDRTAAFPPGCFPPRLPFVRAGPPLEDG